TTTTTFLDLPIDLIYDLFEYFYLQDLFYAFWNINQNLNQIITNSTLPLYINLTPEDIKNDFLVFLRHEINPHQISLLKVNNLFTSQRLLEKQMHKSFTCLRSLTLNNMNIKQITPILNYHRQQKQLQYLNIDASKFVQFNEINDLIEIVLQLASLTTVVLNFMPTNKVISHRNLTLTKSNIKCLTVKSCCHLNTFYSLL
ncbi:unnamed protein product, partial [Didymodactylos carnosus]